MMKAKAMTTIMRAMTMTTTMMKVKGKETTTITTMTRAMAMTTTMMKVKGKETTAITTMTRATTTTDDQVCQEGTVYESDHDDQWALRGRSCAWKSSEDIYQPFRMLSSFADIL